MCRAINLSGQTKYQDDRDQANCGKRLCQSRGKRVANYLAKQRPKTPTKNRQKSPKQPAMHHCFSSAGTTNVDGRRCSRVRSWARCAASTAFDSENSGSVKLL